MANVNISFGPCLLCGGQIVESGVDPVWLEVSPRGRRSAVWFAHAACLARHVAPTFPRGFIDEEAADWLKLESQ